jgi:hypothetical protein
LIDGPGSYRATLDLERKLPAIAGPASVFDVAYSIDDFDGIERIARALGDASASSTISRPARGNFARNRIDAGCRGTRA